MPAIKFADRSIQFFVAIQYLNIVSAKISVIPADPQKGYAPSVTMDIRRPSPRLKTGKGEADVRRYIAVHSEQLAHGVRPSLIRAGRHYRAKWSIFWRLRMRLIY